MQATNICHLFLNTKKHFSTCVSSASKIPKQLKEFNVLQKGKVLYTKNKTRVQPTVQEESGTLCPLRPFFQVGPCDPAGIRLEWEDEVRGFKLVLAFASPSDQLAVTKVYACEQTAPQTLAPLSHLAQDTTRLRHAQRSPSSCCYTINLLSPSDNNVLSPQACCNTCCCDQLLANACNVHRPQGLTLSWGLAKITSQHQRRKSHPNPSNLTPSFIPITRSTIHSAHIISTSLSLGSSHFTHSIHFLGSAPFLWPLVASWDSCMNSYTYTNTVRASM